MSLPLRLLVVPVTPFAQNCTLIRCEKTGRGAVVDPGGDLDRIVALAEEHDIALEKILVTHAHVDHAGGVAALKERLDVPVEGPGREDQFWIDRLEASAARYGFPDVRAFTPDRWLEGGDEVSFGALTFGVRHCPGHTPGHVVFVHEGARLAIVGDVLFQGSVGRSDLPRGDHETLIRSIREQLWPLGDDIAFVPGHGPSSTFGYERRTNPFASDFA